MNIFRYLNFSLNYHGEYVIVVFEYLGIGKSKAEEFVEGNIYKLLTNMQAQELAICENKPQ
jgi:hypothetical protein